MSNDAIWWSEGADEPDLIFRWGERTREPSLFRVPNCGSRVRLPHRKPHNEPGQVLK